jgi:hypothetical protein
MKFSRNSNDGAATSSHADLAESGKFNKMMDIKKTEGKKCRNP